MCSPRWMPAATHFSFHYLTAVAAAGGPSPQPKVCEARLSCAPLRSAAAGSATAATCNHCRGPRESFVDSAGLGEPLRRQIRKTFHWIGPFLQLPIHFFKLDEMVAKLVQVLVRRNLLARYHTAIALSAMAVSLHSEMVELMAVAAAVH